MSSDKSRASRACATCRRLKTRCYEASKPGTPCLRCEKIGSECSLATTRELNNTTTGEARADDATNTRLGHLEKTVDVIATRLGIDVDNLTVTSSRVTRTRLPVTRSIGSTAEPETNAPIFVIRDLATEIGVGSPNAGRSVQSGHVFQPSLLEDGKNILSTNEALALLAIFNEHYGRWVFYELYDSTVDLLSSVRSSPALLSACCLIAVRHTDSTLATRLAPQLFEQSKSLLSTMLLSAPQTLDFFQTALILSMWSTTIGQLPMSMDSWLLSGFAIQHCVSTEMFSKALSATTPGTKHELGVLKLWNHLCLVHLHYSVGTKRKSMIGHPQVDKCRLILAFDNATNFEMRMVAEAELYWILYENCCLKDIDLPKIQSALQQWRQTWRLVLDQPRAQFLEMGFKFAQLLAYEQSLKTRSSRVRESLLSEMVHLSAAILSLAMSTADERTKHLSDHIYHMITFAAVTLARLLHMYEAQLTRTHEVAELDSLILTLVSWLKSIGLPSHAAFTLGEVVDAFHKKLRPTTRPSPITLEENDAWTDLSFWASFPEILGPDKSSSGHCDFFPSWAQFDDANS